MKKELIGKEVTVYDRYLFAVPVKGVITGVSDKDGAYSVVFFADNPAAHAVRKHDGKFFHHQQCRLVEEPEKEINISCHVGSSSEITKHILDSIAGLIEAVEEPKPGKIQTEYEWKKERFDLLSSILQNPNSETRDEWLNLDKWLKENKPENWQTLTMKNAKEGLSVRLNEKHDGGKVVHIVEHLCKDGNTIILYCKIQNTSFRITNLPRYEINIAEKD